MLKFEFQNESGADLRREVLKLLGVSENYVPPVAVCQENSPAMCQTAESVASEAGDSFAESTQSEAEKSTRRRRTKAQIEADKAAAEAAASEVKEPETKVADPEPDPEPVKEVKPPDVSVAEDQKITEQILRMACVKAQDRLGVGEPVVEVLKQFGSTNCAGIKEEDRRKVYDLIIALGTEEKQSF